MQISPIRSIGLEISRAFKIKRGLVRRPEISGSAEEPRNVLREHIQHLARSFAPGDALSVRRKDRKITIPL